jgi:glycosyltransferase involved in cell wall biosynthesis
MKVLWFSNTPANSDEFFNSRLKGTGGWLKSLDIKLQEKVDLHIVFYNKSKINNFKYLKSNYYPIHLGEKNLVEKLFDRFVTKIKFKEDVNKYLQIINEVRPDIIHVHGTEMPFGFVQEFTNIPVVISIQGNINIYKHKYFSGIEKSHLKWYDNIIQNFTLNNSFYKNYLRFKLWENGETEILKSCKYIIGRTDWDNRISRIFSPNSIYFYVSEILRPVFYKISNKKNKNNKFVIFTTNGNALYKGFETLCHTLSLLNSLDSVDIEWRVAGISASDCIVGITKNILTNNYPTHNLKLLGSLNEEELYSNLLQSDLYVMPSHIENSPNNLSEAMILGVPSIATFVGGTGSLIQNNIDGILIQDGDPWAMAGAIIELKSDPKKMEEIGKNGQISAKKRHNSNQIVDDLLNVYINITKKHEVS